MTVLTSVSAFVDLCFWFLRETELEREKLRDRGRGRGEGKREGERVRGEARERVIDGHRTATSAAKRKNGPLATRAASSD